MSVLATIQQEASPNLKTQKNTGHLSSVAIKITQPHYKMLTAVDLHNEKPMKWLIHGILPSKVLTRI